MASPTPIPFARLDHQLTAGADSPFAIETRVIRGIETPVWRQAFPQLRAVLEEGLSNEGLRELARVEARRPEKPGESGRTWKVTRTPDDPPLPRVAWSMTIVDVFAHVRDAESYRAAIHDWAGVTLEEMQVWL